MSSKEPREVLFCPYHGDVKPRYYWSSGRLHVGARCPRCSYDFGWVRQTPANRAAADEGSSPISVKDLIAGKREKLVRASGPSLDAAAPVTVGDEPEGGPGSYAEAVALVGRLRESGQLPPLAGDSAEGELDDGKLDADFERLEREWEESRAQEVFPWES